MIVGAAHLQTSQAGWLGRQLGEPRAVVVDIAAVTCLGEVRVAAVAEHHAVVQAQPTRRDASFGLQSHDMYWGECSAELDHLRPDDRCLQPGPMVEGGVPISNRCMKLTERDLEVIVVVETHKGTLYTHVVGVRLRREGHFPEVADLSRKSGCEVQHKLSHVETTV